MTTEPQHDTAKSGKKSEPNRFRDMQDVKKTEFSEDYRKANICSRLFFIYPNSIIRKAKENNYQFEDEMVINMN